MERRFWRLLWCGIGALLVAGFFWFRAEEPVELPVVRTSQTNEQIASRLGIGDVLEQSLEVQSGYYSGVVLYSRSPAWFNQRVTVEMYDSHNTLLGRSYRVATSYDKDGLLRLEFPMERFFVQEHNRGKITIRNHDKELVLLAVTPDRKDVHVPGELFRNGQNRDRLLALSLLQGESVPDSVKQGALAALVFFVGAALAETFVPVRFRWWVYALLLAVVTILALPGFWYSQHFLGIADWDYYFSLHTYYRNIVLQYHQFPFWNPYTCGGTAGLADPEFPGFTITFLLELLFGVPRGVRYAIFATMAIGSWGMLWLGKKLQLSPLASLLAALIATFGTVSLLEIVEGHVNVLASKWIPWIFLAWYSSYQLEISKVDKKKWWGLPLNRWTLLCAIFLGLTFLGGGVYLLMYTGLAFIFLWLLVPRRLEAIAVTVMAGILALGLVSFKLVPVLKWLDEFPDPSYASSTVTLPWLDEILIGRHLHGEYILFGQDSGWHEYGAYVGVGAVALAAVGTLVWWKRRVVRGLFVATIAAILLSSSGPALKYVFDLMWFFPRSNISRFILFAVIPLSLLAGFGLQYFQRKRPNGIVSLVFLGVVALELMTLIAPLSYQAFVLPRVYPRPAPLEYPLEFTTQRYDNDGQGSRTTRAYAAAREGYGVFAYCSVLGPARSAVRTVEDQEDNAPVWVESGQAKATLISWTPNVVKFHVSSPVATKAGLNTNFAYGWWIGDTQAIEVGDRVGISVEAGEHDLVFEYHTPGFPVGVTISVLSLVLLVYLAWYLHSRKV